MDRDQRMMVPGALLRLRSSNVFRLLVAGGSMDVKLYGTQTFDCVSICAAADETGTIDDGTIVTEVYDVVHRPT